jgi:hypothetical protein
MPETARSRRSLHAARIAASLTAILATASLAATAPTASQPVMTDNQLLAQAIPDECFNGLGEDYPPIAADGSCVPGQPKANQSYIWGLTEESGKLWFGTLANAACILDGLGDAEPIANALFACEFGESQYARTYPSIPAQLGDWRPPRIYSYDLATHELVERKVNSPLLRNTLGFRGAGSIGGIAFLGGPALSGNGINIFAFRADTGQFLGACTRSDYTYIRGWKDVGGVLYVGVGDAVHGAVLRWNGKAQGMAAASNFCGLFSEVGRTTADVANITAYTDGGGSERLAVSTVPIRTPNGGTGAGTGIWVSPPIPAGGLRAGHASQWRQVWSPTEYDPDPIVSRFGYAGGAVQYFDGWLYWGTIHLQNSKAYGIHETCTAPYCFGTPADDAEEQALSAGVYRTTSVWRGRNLEDPATREVQLLYGESQLPACCSAPKTFEMRSTGWTPLYGPSGFGNPANEYTWQMAVFGGRLFVGTYDASILQGSAPASQYGADLWRFDSSGSPAVNENSIGLGDRLNYGIRALQPLDDGSGIIVGMANPFNLAPGGGWELRLLKEGAQPKRVAKPKR